MYFVLTQKRETQNKIAINFKCIDKKKKKSVTLLCMVLLQGMIDIFNYWCMVFLH
jgi:hypothetical protein